MQFLLSFLILSGLSFANQELAPPSWTVSGKKIVFVDFQTADYNLEINALTKTNHVKSKIRFLMPEKGYPAFDLVSHPTFAKIDGQETTVSDVSPYSSVKLRYVNQMLEAGVHELEIEHSILAKFINYEGSNVFFESNLGDLEEREFLEQYFPANYEYDQFQINLKITALNTKAHFLEANGEVTQLDEQTWQVQFPEWYNSSSVFVFLAPKSEYSRKDWVHSTGVPITVLIHNSSSGINNFVTEANKVLSSLTEKFGPFPHKRIIIHASTGYGGGMEYAGATRTELDALSHEMTHFYFARSVMPSNGDSGWIDEAIASRISGNPKETKSLSYYESCSTCSLGQPSPYMRATNYYAYSLGQAFLQHISKTFMNNGLNEALSDLHEKFQHTPISNELFKNHLETHAKADLTPLFNRWVGGSSFESLPSLLSIKNFKIIAPIKGPHDVNPEYYY